MATTVEHLNYQALAEAKIFSESEVVARYSDYSVHETPEGFQMHVDNDGNAIRYERYTGDTIVIMNQRLRCVNDFGDRIEIQEYVGKPNHWYTYHICKKTRKPIPYFASPIRDLPKGKIDMRQYRVVRSVDLNRYIAIQGLYGNKSQVFRKANNSAVPFLTPSGDWVSKFNAIETAGDKNHLRVKVNWWKWYLADLNTKELVR